VGFEPDLVLYIVVIDEDEEELLSRYRPDRIVPSNERPRGPTTLMGSDAVFRRYSFSEL
jgi:hypothetical protein